MPSAKKVHREVAERLVQVAGWRTVTRNDAAVVRELYETHAIDNVHALSNIAFFDEFFHYVRELKLWPELEGLDPEKRRRPIYPFIQFVVLTFMRCVGGVQSMLAMRDLLLTDEGLMAMLGFNATQVARGANQRGEDRRREPVEVQGRCASRPSPTTSSPSSPRSSGAVQHRHPRPRRAGVFPKKIDAILDATDDEATPPIKPMTGARSSRHAREAPRRARQSQRAQGRGDRLRLEDLAGLGARVEGAVGDEDRRHQRLRQHPRAGRTAPGEGERPRAFDHPLGRTRSRLRRWQAVVRDRP